MKIKPMNARLHLVINTPKFNNYWQLELSNPKNASTIHIHLTYKEFQDCYIQGIPITREAAEIMGLKMPDSVEVEPNLQPQPAKSFVGDSNRLAMRGVGDWADDNEEERTGAGETAEVQLSPATLQPLHNTMKEILKTLEEIRDWGIAQGLPKV